MMSDPVEAIGRGGKIRGDYYVYLKWTRYAAMADWIIREAGSLEVAPSAFEVPAEVVELPDTTPRYPRSHDRYYTDGGSFWPRRIMIARKVA